ncbi:efflux RND transporter periplasmic adaptor subunit [Cyanobium sp. HWJ4-Hawea]|uniref:efflux RND transporter periplasmic adaptor subunit n=1 Tax=Cyanobium sp. HWJ4-Hawea TaxID=2823713 RepID=UPI0028F3E2D2|nr:efflux RND transporter periplasmic adaptor subunit [Cyanobium sp. HWJ4-Hawea]
MRRRRIWLGAGAALVVLAGVAISQQRQGSIGRQLPNYTVRAESGSLPGVVSATGELDAEKRVNVSPKRQGVIEALYVEEGDAVTQGQPLARMDSGDLEDRLKELGANLRSAQAQLARSRSELQRNGGLYRQRAISRNDYEKVRSSYLVDLEAVEAAKQRLEARGVERQELVVRAPFGGVISQRFADPGSFVTPTTTASATAGATSSSIVELAQGLEVVAKVPESDIGRIRLGQNASVRVDAFPDKRFAAQVKRITPRAVKLNNVTSFDVVLNFLERPTDLRIGMTADVGFQTGRIQAKTLIPTVAVVTEDGRPGVLLVGPDNQPKFQPVELGISSGKSTQIISGLSSGTQVFIDLPPWAKKRK